MGYNQTLPRRVKAMPYQIKTVARLTGIPRNTLLAWERRYELVSPERAANGYRLYSDADLARLNAVRQLIDQGYKVSEAAALLQSAVEAPSSEAAGGVRVAILHASLATQLEAANTPSSQLDVVASATTVGGLTATCSGEVDVLVADLELLGEAPRLALQLALKALETTQAVVLYRYTTTRVLQQLVSAGARLVPQPARATAVVQAVVEQHALSTAAGAPTGVQGAPPPVAVPAADGSAPARRFTDDQLARFIELRSSLDCECPNHLAAIVRTLVGFEEYAAGCSTNTPADAALHGWLGRNTARARAVIEELLEEVVTRDGLKA